MQRTCPSCGTLVLSSTENYSHPFCSERCKMLDLANWLDGNYRITAHEEDVFSQDTDFAFNATQDTDELS